MAINRGMYSENEAAGKRVALFGATGLVGGECLALLRRDPGFGAVEVFVRRATPATASAGAVHEHVVDFEELERHAPLLAVDAVICALGTTMRRAGSRGAFRRVDHDHPVRIAQLALERGASHFLLVSAVGADPGSRLFYNRVKGEVERDVRSLGFEAVTIVRPSLLLGERDEFRPGEFLGKALGWLVPGRYRPVRARAVASVLVRSAREDRGGVQVIESERIRRLAARAR